MSKKKKTAKERVLLARSVLRPSAPEYMEAMFEEFIPLDGDRLYGEDESVIGGIAFFHGIPVTIIGQRKGRDFDEKLRYRFGMPNPEGYRKAIRLMKQAEKFNRPVITFVDTPGAYPGREAEERGQGDAIARCIQTMSRLQVPTVSVMIGEGGSGGALAFAASDRLLMLENSIYSILSPEGFASILWHDSSRWGEAAEVMKLTAQDLKKIGICDRVIPEAPFREGSDEASSKANQDARDCLFEMVDAAVWEALCELLPAQPEKLRQARYLRFRKVGKPGAGSRERK